MSEPHDTLQEMEQQILRDIIEHQDGWGVHRDNVHDVFTGDENTDDWANPIFHVVDGIADCLVEEDVLWERSARFAWKHHRATAVSILYDDEGQVLDIDETKSAEQDLYEPETGETYSENKLLYYPTIEERKEELREWVRNWDLKDGAGIDGETEIETRVEEAVGFWEDDDRFMMREEEG